MLSKLKEICFDWDQWNVQKNEKKHGVSCSEAASAFFDAKYKLFEDLKHSFQAEKRYILFGKGSEGKILMVGFTIRINKVRIITARTASSHERRLYEKEI
jgi:uncharacterized DUF497 family protein